MEIYAKQHNSQTVRARELERMLAPTMCHMSRVWGGGPRKKLHLMAQTNKQTNGHGDSMTESAQLGRFSEKGNKVLLSLAQTQF